MENESLNINELFNELNKVSVPNIADAMDGLDIECKWISKGFKSLNQKRFTGLADTVEWGATRKTKDLHEPGKSTWSEVGDFVRSITKDKTPKVYVSGSVTKSSDFVLAGGLSMTYLDKCGYVGSVLNGSLRDIEEIEGMDMPVWFSNVGVMDSQGCMKVLRRGEGCTVNGFKIEQNDVITGDKNGVVAFSKKDLPLIIDAAKEIFDVESTVIKKIMEGKDLFELINEGGHI